jgi:DNA repair protein RadC
MRRAERYQLAFDIAVPSGVAPDNLPYHREDIGGLTRLDSRELTLSRFVRAVREPIFIQSPQDAAAYLMTHVFTPFRTFDQEELWVLLMNRKSRITHDVMLYRGTLTTSLVRVGELYKEAVRLNAPMMLLSHCHPSGDPTPSPEDIQVTTQARLAGELLNIELLDHIIVGDGAWCSLKNFKLGFGDDEQPAASSV